MKIIKMVNAFSLTAKVSVLFVTIVIVIGVFYGFFSLHPHDIPSGEALESPNAVHYLGTDDLGIDIWAQICYGARISIFVGLIVALLAGVGGGIIGIISGYYGGAADRVLMRVTDMIIVIPDLALMIVIGAFFGPGLKNIILVLALLSWTNPARIIRSKVISMKHENYITAAKSYGAGLFHITIRHFLPGIAPLVMVSIIRLMSRAIVTEASLAFLGLGDPTTKSWGLILNHAINFKNIYYTEFWKWWVVSPLIAILALVLSFAFICRELERLIIHKKT